MKLWGGPSGPCPRNNHARGYNPVVLAGSGEILAMVKDKEPRAFTFSGHGPDGPPQYARQGVLLAGESPVPVDRSWAG